MKAVLKFQMHDRAAAVVVPHIVGWDYDPGLNETLILTAGTGQVRVPGAHIMLLEETVRAWYGRERP